MIRTDIFAVTPAQIGQLDDRGLVDLIGRLLHAEARAAGLPLAGINMPLQITVPDDGEDGRIVWEGGADCTAYLSRRHTAFQAKATRVSAATLKAETHIATARPAKRRRAKSGSRPLLRPVLFDAIAAGGAYVVATTKALNKKQIKPLVAAIRSGIAETSHDSDGLAIDIYDANKLAAWATHHQAVALALNERLGSHALSGFKSLDLWGRRDDFRTVPWADDNEPRLTLAPLVLANADRRDRSRNTWTFQQARRAILDHIAEPRRAVRAFGASGLGKTRLARNLFEHDGLVTSAVQAASVIYADHSVVGDAVLQLAHRFADTAADVVLVVDECPDRTHQRLMEAVIQAGSRLRLISIDVENHQMASSTVLTVEVGAASPQLISTIVASIDARLNATVRSYIADIAQGFPRMAVQGSRAAGEGGNPIGSAAELIDRIIWGRRNPDAEALRALEVAALFDVLRIKGEDPTDLAVIAPTLAEMSEPRMREHLVSFAERGIVVEKGRFAQVQPIPLAAHLGRRRLKVLGAGGVGRFFAGAQPYLQSRLLDRLKWLDMSEEARAFATGMLSENGIGSLAALDTELGARCFDRLVHLVPDLAMDTLDRELGPLSIEHLQNFREGRRHIVWALEKLVFRAQTFNRAARLLLRLAAAETEPSIGNNATGEFKRLFQRELSGTEATPTLRLDVLDEGLADPRLRGICIEAAGVMLDSTHFSRSGGAETIGSQAPLKDWRPSIWRDIWDFHCAGLDRLAAIATGDTPEAPIAQKLIGTHIRGLLSAVPFERIAPIVRRVAAHVGTWHEAIRDVSHWLYFDRRKHDDAEQSAKVRGLYDDLLPADIVDQALLFASGWTTDIHDPDQDYDDRQGARNDLYYSDRKVDEFGRSIAGAGDDALQRCLIAGVQQKLNSGFILGKSIAETLPAPEATFGALIALADSHGPLADHRFVQGFLNGVEARDKPMARRCLDQALASPNLGQNATGLLQGIELADADMPRLIELLREGRVPPDWCAHLSWGRGLDAVGPDALAPFLDGLIASGPDGCWSALEIVSMVQHGKQELPETLAERLRRILACGELFAAASRKTRDAYLVSTELARLAAHGGINAGFARAFVRELLDIAKLDHDMRYDFEQHCDEMLASLIAKAPGAVWAEVATRLETCERRERWRLDHLLEPDRDDRSGAGPLSSLPAHLYLDWVRQDPGARAAAVAQWLPVIDKDEAGNRIWHPALESFVVEFGNVDGVLSTIGARLRPSSWWGSLVPYLEPWLPLLEQWQQHSEAPIRRWADAAYKGLLRQIEAERQDDAEREVGVW